MIKKQWRSAEDWKEIIEEFLKSGASQKVFTEKHGLCRATLADWSKKLGIPLSNRRRSLKKQKEQTSLTFLEIDAPQPFVSPPFASVMKWEVSWPQGPTLKVEGGGTWEQSSILLKTFMERTNASSP